jgi:hypothetical protein
MKIREDKLCGHVARLGVDRLTSVQNVHGQPEAKTELRRLRCRWKNDIKHILKEKV